MSKLTIITSILLLLSFITAHAQEIPNASFETWVSGEPVDWNTTNQNILGTQFDVVNKESSNPQSGLYSARLEVLTKNIFLIGPVTVPGVLTLSQISIDVLQANFNISGGYPFTGMPQQLAGYLKYQPVGTDTCYYGFALSKWNNGTRDTIGFAADTVSGTIANWTPFQLPIAYDIWAEPDTLSILFLCTNVNDQVVHTGTKMWVDNLSFIYGTVGIEGITFGKDYRIYADASTRQLIIDTHFETPRELNIQLFNMAGQIVAARKKEMATGREWLDTGHLTPGTYILRIADNQQLLASRKINILE